MPLVWYALPPSCCCSGFTHFLFFFFPAIIMGNMAARLIMLGALFTGPVFTQLLAARHMDTYKVRLQQLLHLPARRLVTHYSPPA